MSHQIIAVEPETELRFRGPFKEPTPTTMTITNKTDKKVCFKVKTTAPKRYCVKPTTGLLEPKATVNILVNLQPFDINDPTEKGKHKFQVLSVLAPDGDVNVDQVWKEASPETVHDWKLKCVLEMPEEPITASTAAPVSAASAPAPSATKEVKSEPASADGVPTERVKELEDAERKALDEISRLREDISRMTMENIKLKEEGLRLRRSATGGESKAEVLAQQSPVIAQPTYPTAFIVMLLIAVLAGYIAGKIF